MHGNEQKWESKGMLVRKDFKPFGSKVWLSSPTMHGDEQKWVDEAIRTNWMSTVGDNINEVERLICEKTGSKYAVALSACTAGQVGRREAVWTAAGGTWRSGRKESILL